MTPSTRLDQFDFDALQVASAMYGSPDNLVTKLINIWDLSCRMVVASERKFPGQLKKLWRSDAAAAFGAHSLDARASMAAPRGLFGQHYDDGFAFAYFGIIKEAYRIGRALRSVGFSLSGADAEVSEFLAEMLSKGSSGLPSDVVIHFFPLQLHCYQLVRMVESRGGTPPDPLSRRKRSVAGGQAAHVGEQELKEDIMRFFEAQQVGAKYTSVNALFDAFEHDLEGVLEKYQSRIGKASMRSHGKLLTYGRPLKAENLARKINEWQKRDPDFKSTIERICTIRRH